MIDKIHVALYNRVKAVRLMPNVERAVFMKNDGLYNRIIEYYCKTNSVKMTAEELGTSVIKVRRVLITEGLWSSATSRKIVELHEQGLSTKEIAKKLHYSEKNVQAFLPYSRGVYGQENQSVYSLSCKEYRERNQHAAQRQVNYGFTPTKKYLRNETVVDNNERLEKNPVALKLHLELNMDNCNDQDKGILRKYGKMKNAIARDVIVPADITLHALHYAIQKLFGWQNGHLHHYALPEDVFEKITENSLAKWCRLAGVYFRFPNDKMNDLFWDDDYSADMSVKSWLKSKCKGPYQYGGLGDYYFENQKSVLRLKNELPSLIEESHNRTDLSGNLNYLLERLSLLEYLYLPGSIYSIDSLEDKLGFLEDNLKPNHKTWDFILDDIDNKFELFCKYAELSTIRMQTQSYQIDYIYGYDYSWKVAITLVNAYYQEDVQNSENANLQRVISTNSPVCVESDGLTVFDDVSGIHGFIDFLVALYSSKTEEERQKMMKWARSFGWTGRESKPQNIL